MRTTVGAYIIDVDPAATKAYYDLHTAEEWSCDCAGCRNFIKAAGHLPKKMRKLLETLGADPAKAVHLTPTVALEDGRKIYYTGWYHLCGTIVSPAPHSNECDLSISDDCWLIGKAFPRPAIQADFSAILPWVLEEENTY